MLKYYYQLLSLMLLKQYNFSKANGIPTHLTLREKIKLYELARQCEGDLLEIGSYLGASSCFLAMGINANQNVSTLFCVDTWENDAMSEGRRDTYQEFLKNTRQFSSTIHALRGTSEKIASLFDYKINLLFIDADHSYEKCRQDWLLWKPYLSPGSTVILHDIGWADGVKRVAREEIAPIARDEGRLPNMYWATI